MKFISLFFVLLTLNATSYSEGPFSSVPELCNVPLSDDKGVVVNVRKLIIPGVPFAYNPSIINIDGEYLVAFRKDYLGKTDVPSKTRIGFLRFDSNFNSIGAVKYFKTSLLHCEDPRLFFHNKRLFLSYTHLDKWDPVHYSCHTDMCELDEATLRPLRKEIHLRKKHPEIREKNWTPFSYTGDKDKQGIYFVHQFNPLTIFRITHSGGIVKPFSAQSLHNQRISWEKKWGTLRGTTPAVRIGHEYLTFFHSVLISQGIRWYLMGALTLDAQPPFRIRKISRYPILYKGQYSSPIPPFKQLSFLSNFRVNFPCGFVEGVSNERKVIYLVCGENDSSINLITIDKKRLLHGLKTVKSTRKLTRH